jgi:hypothetical protein
VFVITLDEKAQTTSKWFKPIGKAAKEAPPEAPGGDLA